MTVYDILEVLHNDMAGFLQATDKWLIMKQVDIIVSKN